MTTLTIIQFSVMTGLVLLGAYALYREKDLIKFERKVKKYIKAFFKALYYTILEKRKVKDSSANIQSIRNAEYNEEYEKMLADLNKASKIEDFLVA